MSAMTSNRRYDRSPSPKTRLGDSDFRFLLSPRGRKILAGDQAASLFAGSDRYYVGFRNVLNQRECRRLTKRMDRDLHPLLSPINTPIPPDYMKEMTESHSEALPKAMLAKTAFLQRRTARSYLVAEEMGLVPLLRSESLRGFVESVTGYRLKDGWGIQVLCYEHGGYVSPHNDHHPENEAIRDGYIDFHITLANDAVGHQWLVYEKDNHLSECVNVNVMGGIAVYKLPFWHYTTPLVGKASRESQARRWVLIATFEIDAS